MKRRSEDSHRERVPPRIACLLLRTATTTASATAAGLHRERPDMSRCTACTRDSVPAKPNPTT
jgi:hypothetical protein|eukprot:COSAG06_NODE_6571_length_2876_cov_1.645661_2_plen_63_part_00